MILQHFLTKGVLFFMRHSERIQYLENLDRETISPSELAMLLGGRPFAYNMAARDGSLSLPHIFRGRNLRIFRQPLLDLLKGGGK